jgi:lipid-binding SYLF domain-containing protein
MLIHCFYKLLKLAMLSCLAMALNHAWAQDGAIEAQQLVDQATQSVQNFTAEPSMQKFRDDLKNAKAILIVPRSIEVGFIIGGSGGSGVMLARNSGGGWNGPAFYSAGGGSVGLQAGAKVSELILLIMNEQALGKMLEGELKFGAGAGVTVGIGAAANTNIEADVLGYALSKGAFGGVSLEGGLVESRPELDSAYYGKALTAKDILISGKAGKKKAVALRSALQKASAR